MTHRFRVWDGDEMHLPPHRFMLGNELCKRSSEIGTHEGLYVYTLSSMHHAEAMHYTGLNDAEGTPVYQSDLMKMVNVEGVFEVIWSTRNARWEIVTPGNDHGFPLGAHNHSHIVVGDKFQTPELLDD